MKLNYPKNKSEILSVTMLLVSAVLCVAILVRTADFFIASARAEHLVGKIAAQSKPDPNSMEKYFAKSREIAQVLKKQNLFAPPLPKQNPAVQLSGILGDEALINDKWYKAGDRIADAKIVAIEPTQIKVEQNGKITVIKPIDFAGAPQKNKGEGTPRPGKGKAAKTEPQGKPSEAKVSAAAAEQDPLGWLGIALSDAAREKFLQQWNSMSDEQKEKAKEEWNKMSDEQKQQAAEAWGKM